MAAARAGFSHEKGVALGMYCASTLVVCEFAPCFLAAYTIGLYFSTKTIAIFEIFLQ
jgi:hypothetical protein